MSESGRRDQAVERGRIGDGVRGAAAARERSGGRRADDGHGAPVEEPAEGRLAERSGETIDRRRRSEGDDIDLSTGHRLETGGERRVALESLIAIKRAGADIILTYYAAQAASWLAEEIK